MFGGELGCHRVKCTKTPLQVYDSPSLFPWPVAQNASGEVMTDRSGADPAAATELANLIFCAMSLQMWFASLTLIFLPGIWLRSRIGSWFVQKYSAHTIQHFTFNQSPFFSEIKCGQNCPISSHRCFSLWQTARCSPVEWLTPPLCSLFSWNQDV